MGQRQGAVEGVVMPPVQVDAVAASTCRLCGHPDLDNFCDLGLTPLANDFLPAAQADRPQVFYPLQARVCTACRLVQVPCMETPARLFSDYAYFSSYSESWIEHARSFAETMTARLGLGANALVIEAASNDGYLLRHFRALGIPVLGIEPAANVAHAAQALGIPTLVELLDRRLADRLREKGQLADLVVANNVLAHVPDLHDFVASLAALLKPEGVLTLEFPHLLHLIQDTQFDTIYHEHFSYFTLHTARRALEQHGLVVFDVDSLVTHGGSLRIHARTARGRQAVTPKVDELLAIERQAGLLEAAAYAGFQARVDQIKCALLEFLLDARHRGKRVVGYGAAAKASTLLNYSGVRADLLPHIVDRSPHKHGRLIPGVRIPVHDQDMLRTARPDYLLMLAWNLKDEIMRQTAFIREWGGQFVTAIPRLQVLP